MLSFVWLICGTAEARADTDGACSWSEHKRAQKAFREGFEAYRDEEWSEAIRQFKAAKEDRRTASADCFIALDRNPRNRAYYVPRFYLGVAAYNLHSEAGDETKGCEEALVYFGDALRPVEGGTRSIYDKYPGRLKTQGRELRKIMRTCEGPTSGDAMASLVPGGRFGGGR